MKVSPLGLDGLYEATGGRVVVEAENFSKRHRGIGVDWTIVPSEQNPSISFLNYTGTGYLQVLPEPEWLDVDDFVPYSASKFDYAGRWDQSLAYYDEAVRIDPSADNLYYRALAHERMGRRSPYKGF